MAMLTRNGLPILRRGISKHHFTKFTRFLYTPESLNLDTYAAIRKHMSEQFTKPALCDVMSKSLEKPDCNLLLIDDLEILMHLVEKNPEDLDLLDKAIKRFSSDGLNVLTNFVYGPIAMKAYHHLNEPKRAMEIFRDPKSNEAMFNKPMAYHVLMDLLYKNEMYEEVKEVYSNLSNSKSLGFPGFTSNLMMAACYKQNTPESLKCALDANDKLKNTHQKFVLSSKGKAFLAALCLKQNEPTKALEILHTDRKSSIDFRNMELEANALLKNYAFVLDMLDSTLVKPALQKLFLIDSLERVEKSMNPEEGQTVADILDRIEKIRARNLVEPTTLDEYLTWPINLMLKQAAKNLKDKLVQNRTTPKTVETKSETIQATEGEVDESEEETVVSANAAG